MRHRLVLACLALLLAGCARDTNTPPPQSHDEQVRQWIDQEAGVVCWLYRQGISCLPIRNTNLWNKQP